MQKLSSLIFKQTTRTLAAAGLSIAVGLSLYAVATVVKTGRHAETLLVNQALTATESAVISQNQTTLQPELDRYINEWNKSETLEARTEVYLDGAMIAQAGSTRPFEGSYSTIRQEGHTPSGSLIEVRVDLSKGKYWLQVFFEGATLEALVFLLFLVLRRRLGRLSHELSEPIADTAQWIQSIARGLPESAKEISRCYPARCS